MKVRVMFTVDVNADEYREQHCLTSNAQIKAHVNSRARDLIEDLENEGVLK